MTHPSTRERILEIAHDLVLRRGFAATTLEQILARTGVTKGAFFHHFKSKDELARALLTRYLAAEQRLVDMTLRQAERLVSDPLQQVLVTLALLEEFFAGLREPPGCLVAAYLYQSELMTPAAIADSRSAFLVWRRELAAKLRAASRLHPPRLEPDYEALGDMLTSVVEGGMVVSRLFDDPKIMVRQLRQLRSYIELMFGAERRRPAD